jgi:hypothetical protein
MIMISIKTGIIWVVICLLISGFVSPALALDGFTQSDRERLVRVEAIQTTFMQQMDKRLKQVDKRIELVDKRFGQTADIFYALAAIFTTLFAAVFGFAWWDRRSILITARAEVEASTQDIRGTALRSERLIEVLQSFAENVPNLKVLMRQANLL